MPSTNAENTADTDKPQLLPTNASHGQIITGFVQTALSCVIRGLLLTLANFDPETVTKAIARESGRMLGQAVVGDLGQLLKARANMREAFNEGMNSVKPAQSFEPSKQKMQG